MIRKIHLSGSSGLRWPGKLSSPDSLVSSRITKTIEAIQLLVKVASILIYEIENERCDLAILLLKKRWENEKKKSSLNQVSLIDKFQIILSL